MNFISVRHSGATAQRAAGRLGLGFALDGAQTRVQKFYQQGCLKARLPRPQAADMCEAVLMNISGGVASGDCLNISVEVEAEARLSLASAAAERVYRALDDAPAVITTKLNLRPGAVLDYLPQETILFDGFALNRTLEIEMAEDASFLGVESLVFGRQAMGEIVREGWLKDRIVLRRGGKLIIQDMTRLEGDIAAALARKAVANGAMAVAALVYAAPHAAAVLPALRAALEETGCEAAASAFEGIIFARILACSAMALRKCVVAALHVCNGGRALPRAWQG